MDMTLQHRPRVPLVQGDPALDTKAFRRTLGQYPTGVTVITACHGVQLLGMAVNSFAAVSLAPPLVAWSIRRESRSAQAFLEAGHFAVSILAEDHVDVSQAFGAGHADRFEQVAWHAGLGGAPLIDGAIAHLECSTEAAHDGGDHHILVGRVRRHARFEGSPLVFAQGQYAVTQNHPGVAAAAHTASPTVQGQGTSPGLLRLLSDASQRMSRGFQVHRDALDLTPSMGRILAVLHESARTLDDLEHATYLGHLNLEDALSSLCANGLVVQSPDARYALTVAGRSKREALGLKSDQFLRDRLRGLAAADIAATCRVLSVLQTR